jgi:hypothetical protein
MVAVCGLSIITVSTLIKATMGLNNLLSNNTEPAHSASQALSVPPQSQNKADQDATLTSVFTQQAQKPSNSPLELILSTVWKAKEE